MNKLIILNLLFLASCATNTRYKRRDIYSVKYTVREYYYPSNNAKAVPSEKWKAKSDSVLLKKKAVKKKRVALSSRLDCQKVFKEINQCMR